MWNCKTLKIQTFQNWFKILKLQKSFTTHKWGKMYMMCLKSCNLLYKEKECGKKNGYDLKLLSFLKMKHWIYKESGYFQNFIFIPKWWRKKHVMYLDNYNKLQNKLFQNSFMWKNFFGGKKDIHSFLTLILLAHYILFAPHYNI